MPLTRLASLALFGCSPLCRIHAVGLPAGGWGSVAELGSGLRLPQALFVQASKSTRATDMLRKRGTGAHNNPGDAAAAVGAGANSALTSGRGRWCAGAVAVADHKMPRGATPAVGRRTPKARHRGRAAV